MKNIPVLKVSLQIKKNTKFHFFVKKDWRMIGTRQGKLMSFSFALQISSLERVVVTTECPGQRMPLIFTDGNVNWQAST